MADDETSSGGVQELSQRLDDLLDQVETLSRRVAELETSRPGHSPQAVKPAAPSAPPPFHAPPRPNADSLPRPPRAERPLALKLDRNDEQFEWDIGGRFFAWLAGFVLILAFGFGVHWVWTTFSLPIWTRVAGLHLGSIGILVLAAYVGTKRDLATAALTLCGVGLFALYATAYASLRLYQIWSEPFAFAELTAITLLAIVLAVRTNSVTVILLGALGGYLTPFLTATERGGHIGLFLYLAFLNVALLSAAAIRGWTFIKPLTLAAISIMFLYWIGTGMQPRHRWSTEWLLALHAGIHTLSVLIPAFLAGARSRGPDLTTVAGAAMGFFGGTWLLFNEVPGHRLALLCWLLGVFELGLFGLAWLRLGEEDRLPRVLLGLGSAFLVLAIPLSIDDRVFVGLAWLIEGAAFLAVGVYFADTQLYASGLAVLGLGGIRLWGDEYAPLGNTPRSEPWYRDRSFLMLEISGLIYLASGAMAFLLPRRRKPSRADEEIGRWMGGILLGAGNFMMLIALTVVWKGWGVPIVWTINVALLWAIGFFIEVAPLRHYAFLLSMAAINCLAIATIATEEDGRGAWLSLRTLSLVFLASVDLAAGLNYWRRGGRRSLLAAADDGGEAALAPIVGFAGHLILFIAITLEIHQHFQGAGAPLLDISDRSSMAELASYSVFWALQAAVTIAVGLWLRYDFYRWLGIALFLVTVIKVFLVDLANLQLFPRVVALAILGVALLATSMLYQRFARPAVSGFPPTPPPRNADPTS